MHMSASTTALDDLTRTVFLVGQHLAWEWHG